MRIAHNRLCVRVADDADALVAQHLVDVGVEFGFELRVLDVVDVEVDNAVVDSAETGTAGAEVRMVVGTIEKFRCAGFAGDDSKKTAHKLLFFKDDKIYIGC